MCVCSGALMFIMVYICTRITDLLNCFIRPLALWDEICDWKSRRQSVGVQDGR